MGAFLVGDIVKVVYTLQNDKMKEGAIAKIVDGEKLFPKFWDDLKKQFTDDSFYDITWVVWNKKDSRWRGAEDGAYLAARFARTAKDLYDFDISGMITTQTLISEPKNNDNRETCYWCKNNTVKKQGFTSSYDYCERCKK